MAADRSVLRKTAGHQLRFGCLKRLIAPRDYSTMPLLNITTLHESYGQHLGLRHFYKGVANNANEFSLPTICLVNRQMKE